MQRALAACCSLLFGVFGLGAGAQAGQVQFDAIGASSDWLALREQVPAAASATDACAYPGLDPSRFAGVRIHFMALTPAARRGEVFAAGPFDVSFTLYAPAAAGACTDDTQAQQQWAAVERAAAARGIVLSAPRPLTLGRDVPGAACTLGDRPARRVPDCERHHAVGTGAQALRVSLSYTAVPQAPDLQDCQFIGRQMVAVLQVSGRGLGEDPTQPLPGGVATRGDCRGQVFMAPRLYRLGDRSVLLFGFRGASIADGSEHPSVAVF